MYEEQKIIAALSAVEELGLSGLNDIERIVVLCNALIVEAEKRIPNDLKKDAQQILSNGKRVSYELLLHEENFGLWLALKSHEIISVLHKEFEIDD